MISKAEILKFVRHVYKRGQGIPDRRLIHPRREWLIGITSFLLVVGVGAFWSIQSFSVYSHLDKRDYQLPQTIPNYNEKLITTALEQYSNREDQYQPPNNLPPEPPLTSTSTDTATSTPDTSDTSTTTISEETDSLEVVDNKEGEVDPETDESEEETEVVNTIDIVQ